jgi:hypothetical protein
MKKGLSIIFATLVLEATAQNIVINGSFESAGTTLAGWSSTEGYGWESVTTTAADGQTFAIISGNLYQDLPTVPGQVYRLRYAVAGNPGFQGFTPLETFWGGNFVTTTLFDTTGHSNENLGWIYVTNNLTATASTTRLWFANPNYGSSTMPYLDAVSAVPFSEPPTSCVGLPSGIISWWKGEGSGSDTAGSNFGTLLNGVVFTNGMWGQAFYFPGSNQCVQIPYSATLAASNYSIEAWVQPLTQIEPDAQKVLFAQNNGQCQLLARAGISGVQVALQFAVDPSNSVSVLSTSELPIGQFSHVGGTWDGTTLRLYLNGALDAQSTPVATPFDSGCAFYIGGIFNTSGGSCSNVSGFFNGLIDEISYYRRALSDAEINSIFQAGGVGKCYLVHSPSFTLQPASKTVYAGSSVTFSAIATGDSPIGYQWRFNGSDLSGRTTSSLTLTNVQPSQSGNYSVVANNAAGTASSSNALLTILPAPPCVTVTNGLVAWWKAETNLLDGWDSNDGSLLFSTNSIRGPGGNPALGISYVPGKVGNAFSTGTNGVFVANNASLRLTNGLTIEGWIYPTSLSGGLRTILSKFDPPVGSATNSSYYFGANNGSLIFRVSSTGGNVISLLAPQPLQLSQWSHVAATYDAAVLRLYLNGLLVAQTNYSAGIFAGTADAGIGAVPFLGAAPFLSSGWYYPWSGYLDEISLYNRGLSDGEISDIYSADLTGKCLAPPLIAIQPQSQAVPLNEDALFLPKVFGSKPLKYQWRLNGTNLLNATASRLAIERVQSNSVGNYSFIVTNTLGRATSSVAALSILPPLSCVSAPTGIVAWWPANNFTNDVIGTNHVHFIFSPFGGATYATGKVAQCFNITNRAASVPNSPVLNIASNADFSIEAWLKVSAKNPSDPSLYIVQKMSSQTNFFPPFPPTTFAVGYSLLLYNGQLACQVTAPRSTLDNIPTYISSGPDVGDGLFHHIAFTFHRNALDGGRLYVDGQNVLTFDTRLDGLSSISNSASLVIGDDTVGSFLSPQPAERIDELSVYNRALSPAEILAIRQAGAAGKCIPPPTILIPPANQLVQAGSNATLRVVASGFPTLNYRWLKNGSNVAAATSSTLSISNTTIADAGQYSLVVSNIGGTVTSAVATLIVNRPPSASNLNAATIQDQPISIPIEKLLLFASDADGDPLTLSSVASPSTNGGVIVRGATDVTYTPPAGYIGSDSFSYSVSDGRGGFGSGSVFVQVRSANNPSGNLLPLTPIPGGFEVGFAGIPGRTYTIQRAESVTGPWSNLTSVLVGPSGIGIFDDTNSPPPTAFYRTVYP